MLLVLKETDRFICLTITIFQSFFHQVIWTILFVLFVIITSSCKAAARSRLRNVHYSKYIVGFYQVRRSVIVGYYWQSVVTQPRNRQHSMICKAAQFTATIHKTRLDNIYPSSILSRLKAPSLFLSVHSHVGICFPYRVYSTSSNDLPCRSQTSSHP